jgi:hypothetical protein
VTIDSTAPGTIIPIANMDQTIDSSREGNWSWELHPTQPGKFHLSVALTALREDGQSALFRNHRVEIPYQVSNTFSHAASQAMDKIVNTFNLLVAILGVTGMVLLTGVAKFVLRLRRLQKERAGESVRTGAPREAGKASGVGAG